MGSGGNQTSISMQMSAGCERCRVPSLRGVGCEGEGCKVQMVQHVRSTVCGEQKL